MNNFTLNANVIDVHENEICLQGLRVGALFDFLFGTQRNSILTLRFAVIKTRTYFILILILIIVHTFSRGSMKKLSLEFVKYTCKFEIESSKIIV